MVKEAGLAEASRSAYICPYIILGVGDAASNEESGRRTPTNDEVTRPQWLLAMGSKWVVNDNATPIPRVNAMA
eukprot:3220222-Amphidinium_carterae.1